MDRFEKELHACSRLVRDAKHKDDREFWQQAAQRWKALLEDYREPPVSGEKGRARDKTVGEIKPETRSLRLSPPIFAMQGELTNSAEIDDFR